MSPPLTYLDTTEMPSHALRIPGTKANPNKAAPSMRAVVPPSGTLAGEVPPLGLVGDGALAECLGVWLIQ